MKKQNDPFWFLDSIKENDDEHETRKKLIDISTYAVQQLYRLNSILERMENLLNVIERRGGLDPRLDKLDSLYEIDERLERIEEKLYPEEDETENEPEDDVGMDK